MWPATHKQYKILKFLSIPLFFFFFFIDYRNLVFFSTIFFFAIVSRYWRFFSVAGCQNSRGFLRPVVEICGFFFSWPINKFSCFSSFDLLTNWFCGILSKINNSRKKKNYGLLLIYGKVTSQHPWERIKGRNFRRGLFIVFFQFCIAHTCMPFQILSNQSYYD